MKNLIYLFFSLILVSSCKTDKTNQPTQLPTVRVDSNTTPIAAASISSKITGTVLSSGKLEVERGIVWDDSLTSPTIEDNDGLVKDASKGVGSFTVTAVNLPSGRPVYYRVYAKNSMGTAYSEPRSFTTPNSRPIVILNPITVFDTTNATISASLNDSGGLPILSKGICYGTTNNPSITNATRVDASDSNLGFYSIDISGLLKNRRYFVRAFAENSLGVSYSRNLNFTTLP